MVKKYIIRAVGALCILASLALMFLPSWIQLDGIDRSDLKDVRNDVEGICDAATDKFARWIEREEDFKDELKDYDLPYTRGKVKSRFKEIAKVGNSVLDGDVSLKELLAISTKAPGIVKDATNLLESDCASTFFNAVAEYVVYEGNDGLNPEEYDTYQVSKEFQEVAEEAIDGVDEFTFVFPVLTGFLVLIIALAVASAVTHVCNKGRWVKYVFLAVLVVLVVGSCVALSLVPEMLEEVLAEVPELEDMELKMTVTPFLAIALMAAPIVLDIIFERKNKKIYMEG